MAQMVCPHCGHDEYNEIEEGYQCIATFCRETFDEPIENYEFNEAAKEAKDEDRADEARDMGMQR